MISLALSMLKYAKWLLRHSHCVLGGGSLRHHHIIPAGKSHQKVVIKNGVYVLKCKDGL